MLIKLGLVHEPHFYGVALLISPKRETLLHPGPVQIHIEERTTPKEVQNNG